MIKTSLNLVKAYSKFFFPGIPIYKLALARYSQCVLKDTAKRDELLVEGLQKAREHDVKLTQAIILKDMAIHNVNGKGEEYAKESKNFCEKLKIKYCYI